MRFTPRPFVLVPLLPLCLAAAGPSGFAQSVWVGGTGDWNVDANWSPTGVPGAGAEAFITNDGGSGPESHVNVNTNASLGLLVLDVNDTLHVASGLQLDTVQGNLSGAVSVDGTFHVLAGGTSLSLSPLTITSGGSVVISGFYANRDHTVFETGPGGAILNAGNFTLTNTGTLSNLVNTVMTNSGTFLNQGTINGGVFTNTGTLTNAGTLNPTSFDNSGSVINTGGLGPVTFTNSGTIDIHGPGSQIIAFAGMNSGAVSVGADGKLNFGGTNTGSIDSHGTFTIEAGFANSAGGSVHTFSGSTLGLKTFLSTDEPTIHVDSGTKINVASTGNLLIAHDFTNSVDNGVTGAGTVTVASAATFTNSGALSDSLATLNVQGSFVNNASATPGPFPGSIIGTLNNSGTVLNNGTFLNGILLISTLNNGGLYQNNGLTRVSTGLSNTGTIINSGFFERNGVPDMQNSGLIRNEVGATMNFFGGGVLDPTGRLINTSTGVIENHGAMSFSMFVGGSAGPVIGIVNDGRIDNFGELESIHLALGPQTFRNNGTFENHAGGTYTAGSTPIDNFGTFTNGGSLLGDATRIFNGITLGITNHGGGTLDNKAGGFMEIGLVNQAGGTINNAGTITTHHDDIVHPFDSDTQSDGTFNNGGTFINTGHFTSTGTFNVLRGGVVENNAVMTLVQIMLAGTLVNNGSVTMTGGAALTLAGGTLKGGGTVVGNVINSGNVAPGNSPGTMTIDGDYTQAADGTLTAEIGGTLVGQYDQLIVTGFAELAGTLDILLVDGFVAHLGDTFVLITDAGQHGVFSLVELPDLGAGLTWLLTYDATDVMLSVVAAAADVPEPGTLLLILTGLAGLGWRTRSRRWR